MTIIYFILILGIVVFIHELGHFIFAKRAGIYVYEFSLGMGPRLFKWNRTKKIKDKKGNITRVPDETDYCLRLFPIGGYVQMAGEEVEVDENIPEEQRMQSKTWLERFLTVIAGITFNFLLAIIVFFIIGLINGVTTNSVQIKQIDNNYKELKVGDYILEVAGHKVNNYDKLVLELQLQKDNKFDMLVRHDDGSTEIVNIKASEITNEDGDLIGYDYGFTIGGDEETGIIAAIKYGFLKFFSTIEQMFFIIIYLVTGKLSLKMMSGPVGIYNVVGVAASSGFMSLLSLLALISVNVGFINLLPIPAFDGGRAFFLIIEKIKGSPVNPKVENTIHNVGFILLMFLMVYITYNDILRLF